MNKQKSSFGYKPKRNFGFGKTLIKVNINHNEIMKKYSLTIDEINFLSQLEVFNQYEDIPTRTYGIKNGGCVLAHPISVAVFDFYYGAQITLRNGVQISNNLYIWENTIFNQTETKINMGIAKSIFKKVSPNLYSKCF